VLVHIANTTPSHSIAEVASAWLVLDQQFPCSTALSCAVAASGRAPRTD
jgi:hypothetical protein